MAQSTNNANSTQITFDFENGSIAGDFDAGDICIDGGLVLMRELDEKRGYSKRIAACIADWRTGPVRHELEDLVRMELYMKASGYYAGSDANFLRNDRAFIATASPTGDALPGQSSFSRIRNNVKADDLVQMQELLPMQYLRRFKRPPRSVMLNMDSMCDPVYGTQQMSFYNGFYHEYCYTHLYLFVDDGYPLAGVARAGNAGAAEGGLPMLSRVVEQLRSKRKKMKIEYRADSAFLNFQTLDWCEDNNVEYYIGLAPNHALQIAIKGLVKEAHEKYVELFGKPEPLHGKSWKQKEERIRFASKEEGRQQELSERQRTVRFYGELEYAARTWSRKRRVIVRIDYTDEGEDVRFVVTSRKTGSAKWIYENKYCKRARCEMHIKELKSQRCDRLSCAEWIANQFTLLMHLFSYAMQIELREALPRSERCISTATLRSRFFKIAAQIRFTTRSTRIRWSSSHPYQAQFRTLLARLRTAA
jgi:hypothetical protein